MIFRSQSKIIKDHTPGLPLKEGLVFCIEIKLYDDGLSQVSEAELVVLAKLIFVAELVVVAELVEA